MPRLKTSLIACLILSLVCTTFASLPAQSNWRYKKLTTEDGLSSNSTSKIIQDSYGFIWIATANGLNRYDGYEIKSYLPILNDTTSISGSFITSIYEDKDRNIWVATWSNGLNLFDRKTETFKRFIHDPDDSTSISDNSFVGFNLMLEDHAGNFWVGTDNGINLLDRSNGTFKRITIGTELLGTIPTTGLLRERADQRAANRIRGIYQDRKNNLWVGTDWGGLYRYDYESKKFIGYFPDPKDSTSIDFTTPGGFLEDEEGNMWILNYWHGIIKLNLSTGKFQRFPNNYHDPTSLAANRPLNGFILDNHILWIGSVSGLFKFNTKLNSLESVEPIHSDFEGGLTPLLKDKQGNYWISSGLGILLVNNISQGFQKYTNKEDDPASIAIESASIAVDSKGTVYINQSAGIDILDEHKQKIKTIAFSQTVFHDRVSHNLNCAIEDESGQMIFGGTNVFQFTPDQKYIEEKFKGADYPTRGIMNEIIRDSENNLWYAGHCLAVYNSKFNDFDQYYPQGEGNFADNFTYSLLEVNPGRILLGGIWDGLFLFDVKERKFIHRYLIGGLEKGHGSTVNVYKIFRSTDQKIWLGTNYGLSLFNPVDSTFLHYDMRNGLPSNTVNNILEDDHQQLWLATSNGLSRFDPENKRFRNYDYPDGLQGDEFYYGHAAFKHPKTRELWFLGPNGLTVFHPDSLRDNTYIPPVIFTRCVYYNRTKNNGQPITDHTVHNKDQLRFSYSDNIIEFHFAALNFVSPEKNKYAYRLIGFNDDWVQLGTRHEVSFTNLSPGTYTLQVKASNNDGIWNEEGASIKIQIMPPWYRTWWAYSLYALAFLFVIWRLHLYQKARTIRLERERTQQRELAQAKEIEKAYSELGIAHENLKATQKQLIHSEKMASLGELTAGIAHEIQNPLNFVNNFAEVNSELITEMKTELEKGKMQDAKGIADTVDENEQKILFHGKRADAIVKGMLQHSRASSGVKEPTDINALCDEYLRLAYHGLRAKDKSFNAIMNTEFEQEIGKINVIPQDIGRAILNLITNAFYAVSEKQKMLSQTPSLQQTPYPLEGGVDYLPTVTVITRKHRPLPGGRGLDGANRFIEISVSDNGPGIPSSALDKIFQPFFTTKPTGRGTGLGLSLSYDIIKAHGGELKVENKEGEGATFIILLPTGVKDH